MARKTLATVIVEVLTAHGAPMTAAEVYTSIINGSLFVFNSKDPVGIVRSALSRHSVENQHSCASKNKYFNQSSDGRYRVLRQGNVDCCMLKIHGCRGPRGLCERSEYHQRKDVRKSHTVQR
jgi:hypothetical protein